MERAVSFPRHQLIHRVFADFAPRHTGHPRILIPKCKLDRKAIHGDDGEITLETDYLKIGSKEVLPPKRQEKKRKKAGKFRELGSGNGF